MNNYTPRLIFKGLLGLILVLFILHIASYLNVYYNDLTAENVFFKKTNFDSEKNIPTTFAALLHFFASIVLFKVGLTALKIKNRNYFWFSISFVFLFLGFDELLRIHEKFTGQSSALMDNADIFLYSWIVYYLLAALILGLIFLKPLLELPKKTLINFIIAGGIFVFGAVVLENIAGTYVVNHAIEKSQVIITPEIFILATVEELCEMFGVTYFIFSILKFREKYKRTLPIHKKIV